MSPLQMSRRHQLLSIIVATALGLSACVGNEADAVRNQLQDAEVNWERAEVSSYRVEATENVNSLTVGCSWFTVVEVGIVVEFGLGPTANPANCTPISMSVEDLHDTVDRLVAAFISEQGDLAIDWSGEGVPLRIQFDAYQIVDDESDLQITFLPA